MVAVGASERLRGRGAADDTFAGAVLCAGLIDQHLQLVPGATTLTTEVIAIEDWSLPGKRCPQRPHCRSGAMHLGARRAAHRRYRSAYSWRLESELGSITPGKLANFTVLADDPYAVNPLRLKDIEVLGTVCEGRWQPVPAG